VQEQSFLRNGEGGFLEFDPHNGGILCNSEFSAASGIYAAGDDASFFDVELGRRRERSDAHDMASAYVAANNMVEFVFAHSQRPPEEHAGLQTLR